MVERGGHRAVVFDMDGLIIDSEPIYKMAWQRAALEFGYEVDDALYFDLIGLNETDSEKVLRAALGDGFPFGEFRKVWSEIWQGAVRRDGIPLKPGIVGLLDHLDSRDVPYGIATSSGPGHAGVSLSAAGLDGRFTVIVTGDQVPKGKPAPDIYLAAAGRLGTAPERCIALEDSDAGVHAAAAAGMTTLMVPDLKAPAPESAQAAFRVLASLEEAREIIEPLLA